MVYDIHFKDKYGKKIWLKKKMFNGITQTLLEMLPMFIVLVLYWLRVECIKMTYLVAGVIDITNIKKKYFVILIF